MVFSRYPLARARPLWVLNGAWQMRVQAERPTWLLAVHATQPLQKIGWWESDHRHIRAVAQRLDGPVVLAGDFNATLDHEPVRQLSGLRRPTASLGRTIGP